MTSGGGNFPCKWLLTTKVKFLFIFFQTADNVTLHAHPTGSGRLIKMPKLAFLLQGRSMIAARTIW